MSDSYGPIRVYEPSYTYNWWCQCVCEYVCDGNRSNVHTVCTSSLQPHDNCKIIIIMIINKIGMSTICIV